MYNCGLSVLKADCTYENVGKEVLFMIHEERLRPMVKMAMFDKNEGEASRPMIQYAREDYVSVQLLKSFVTGSLAYVILCVMWALYDTDGLMQMLNGTQFLDLLTNAAVWYIVFMVAYLTATYIIYQIRYTKKRTKVKEYYRNLKDINKIYEREERLKSPAQEERG